MTLSETEEVIKRLPTFPYSPKNLGPDGSRSEFRIQPDLNATFKMPFIPPSPTKQKQLNKTPVGLMMSLSPMKMFSYSLAYK